MSKNYKHLCREQRYQIEALFKSGHTQKYISNLLEVHPSTISRELKRNTPRAGVGGTFYRASNAERRTRLRHRLKPKASYFDEHSKAVCRNWLEQYKYSPELIRAEGRRLYGSFVSHETIYKWIWACKISNKKSDRPDRKLYLKLRHARRRHKRGNRHDKRGNIPYRVGIEKRPAIVAQRRRLGDLEVDLMIGSKHQSAILISLDRASLKIRLHKLLSKHSEPVKKALVEAYGKDKRWLRTITFDNDSAFMLHHQIAQYLGVKTYFTRPYTSQDKGSVENRIGILRRFLPKGTDLNKITVSQLNEIENALNNRPVRKFNYKTPNQVFSQKVALMT
jgi:IS30 family transposase